MYILAWILRTHTHTVTLLPPSLGLHLQDPARAALLIPGTVPEGYPDDQEHAGSCNPAETAGTCTHILRECQQLTTFTPFFPGC